MSRNYAWGFVVAGGFAAATGFPVQSGFGILDLQGLAFLAQFLVFVGFCGVAIAISKDAIDLRRALGISLMVWMACAALSEATSSGIRWLMPFPIIFMVTWQRDPLPDEGMLSHLPEPVRQGIAVLAAVVGSHMLASGLSNFRLNSLRFDYFEIFTGAIIYGAAIILLKAPMTWGAIARLGIGSYAASLALFSVALIVEVAMDPYAFKSQIANLIICAMLLVQVWRHFFRPDGWLKLIETLVGGIIASLATEGFLDWLLDTTPWIIFGFPYAIFAAAMAGIGLYLVWSDRIVLKDLGRRFGFGANQSA
ncbi:hypothetical protein K3172_07235 [Qipengyuania sp. 6B39]|uniref:hypothetical protein n=1 Tax=Qipengyuania proteolytica TaxID=2867239 RepID=UPI001C8A0539|nr:hypothetical protein [Qipengyuania proteolytica]MBX7495652.1 hypothetical protein [Qipengyuania proteolytica]